MVDAQPIGFIETSEEEDHVRLRNIALVEAWRRRGIGASLLLGLAAASDKPIRLRVLKGNPARRLYERVGFEVMGDPDGNWWEMVRKPSGQ